jgi:hypothetical protein
VSTGGRRGLLIDIDTEITQAYDDVYDGLIGASSMQGNDGACEPMMRNGCSILAGGVRIEP